MEGGVTVTPESNITGAALPEFIPLWIQVFDCVQLTGAIIGVLANIVTLVTLTLNGDDFSDIIRMLFKYQSIVDCMCCLQATLLFTLPRMWKTGYVIFDKVVCQLWHGQFLFWGTVTLSVWNLVTLALERYLCVCHPLKYQTMRPGHFRFLILGTFIWCFVNCTPSMFQVRYRDGQCYSDFFWDGKAVEVFYYVYGITWFFYAYAIPCALFFLLYGLIIRSFRLRSKANLGASGSSTAIDKATSQLTKTAIVVTVFFILLIGVDPWYYLLGYVGLVIYIFNSPLQKVGVFFSVMNSVVNPFIYAMFMPLYRKSVKDTFLKPCSKK